MPDPRVTKLASVLIHYSLEIKPGQQLFLQTVQTAEELSLAVYAEAIRAGAHVFVRNDIPGVQETFYKYASDEQLDYLSPVNKLIYETFDARLVILADYNTREFSGVDPTRIARWRKSYAPLAKLFLERIGNKSMNWVGTVYPTQALAQEADMSLSDYQNFVYKAGKLDEPDPVAAWEAEARRQRKLIAWLEGKKEARLKGAHIDLSFKIEGRPFVECAGRENFPDGEIFTSPVEDSANGWVRFSYPIIYDGNEVTGVELWFEDGKIVRETASKGGDFLTALLNSDRGARYLGEWGIGTNYEIPKFTKNMLFDEKLGGTIHLAVGAGIPESGGKNESGIHWDMLCDMADSEITIDGEVFYRNGKPVI